MAPAVCGELAAWAFRPRAGHTMRIMDQSELESFRREDRRVGRMVWYSIVAVCIVAGFVIGELWSLGAGLVVPVVLMLGGVSVHLRLHKARWMKRFPELRDEATRWRR